MKGLLILVCALLVLNVVVLLTKPVTAETRAVYKVESGSWLVIGQKDTLLHWKKTEAALNDRAAEGWELVGTYQTGGDPNFIFKRR